MLENAEIRTMITAMGTGVGEDFDVSKLRYHKIIVMTDADVDGSHIRTLLLTFFFRVMPEIIEKGYLYIAQPPLYRLAQGKKEMYLKDESSMRKTLLERACSELSLHISSTDQTLSGNRLVGFMEQLSSYLDWQSRLKRRGYPTPVMQVLLNAQTSSKISFAEKSRTEELANLFAEQGMIVDSINLDEEHSLFRIHLTVKGDTTQSCQVDWNLISSVDYSSLLNLHKLLAGNQQGPFILAKNGTKDELQVPEELLTSLLDSGAKGLHLQRYKGLGEMNPDQLWETTMDREKRTLLQVDIGNAESADEMFTTLMGDAVEPRKEFITENALDVRELDI
jgi:DNA gyrase subunit B